jgi:Tfp pilus assembly protein PilX
MKRSNFSQAAHERGSTMVTVLMAIVILSLIFVPVLSRTSRTYRQVSHIASWQESLTAAEAGADQAMFELRKSLLDPANAFSTWSTTDAANNPLPNNGRRLILPSLLHPGEGNNQLDATVTVDAPSSMQDGSDRQWYRIRAVGTTTLPGGAVITGDKRDVSLRRLFFRRNPDTGESLTRPQSSRVIELLVKPASFEIAITSNLPISLNNYKIVVDSYDSRDPDKSNNGLYDPTKALKNGDIATNSTLIDAGDATINGDAYTNAGTIVNGANISGEQRNDFYQELLPIKKPTWTATDAAPNMAGNFTLAGGTKAAPRRYQINSLNLAGTTVMTIAPSAPGVESYTELWITGDFKASGNGTITIQPNANLKIYVEGNVDIKGNGTWNMNSQPARLQLLGVEPSNPATIPSMNFSGNGLIVAAVYAPNHNVVFGATGSAGTFWGSLSGRSITMGGTTFIHYDEALADAGHTIDYRVRSWFEDHR